MLFIAAPQWCDEYPFISVSCQSVDNYVFWNQFNTFRAFEYMEQPQLDPCSTGGGGYALECPLFWHICSLEKKSWISDTDEGLTKDDR